MNAIRLYRVGHWFWKRKVPIIPEFFFYLNFLIFNSAIPSSCEIGPDTKFAYGGIGVVLHGKCRVGAHCMIGQNVTIGGKAGPNGGIPEVGDNCYISTGAKIIGGVKVGSNSVIGANAVVVKDIPDNCIAAGVPAKVIKTDINISSYWH